MEGILPIAVVLQRGGGASKIYLKANIFATDNFMLSFFIKPCGSGMKNVPCVSYRILQVEILNVNNK